MLKLDHLAVACTDLAQGTAWVEAQLGVPLLPGGKHPRYGTHNRLLGLADGLYLEVIAVDPGAPSPEGARWFALDHFSGPPRLANWICNTTDLKAALQGAPPVVGPARQMQRDALKWQITVPDDGSLPFHGGFPTLMEWPVGVHPSQSLPESGCRLKRFEVSHPEAEALSKMVRLEDPRVQFVTGPLGFQAAFETPSGPRILS